MTKMTMPTPEELKRKEERIQEWNSKTPEEQAKIKANQDAGFKVLSPNGPTSLTMGQSTPMNGQSPLQNNPRLPPTNKPASQNRTFIRQSPQERQRAAQQRQRQQLGDRYGAFEAERNQIQNSGLRGEAKRQAFNQLSGKYFQDGKYGNSSQNNFNQLRGALNPQQPQQNAQQPTAQPQQAAPAQPQQPNPAQPQQSTQPQQSAQPPVQQASQPEQLTPAQDNSSIDQQIAALQQQIAQLQAQKK